MSEPAYRLWYDSCKGVASEMKSGGSGPITATWLAESGKMHSLTHNLGALGKRDVGGPWFMQKSFDKRSAGFVDVRTFNGRYRGEVVLAGRRVIGWDGVPPVAVQPTPMKDTALMAEGTSAIAKTEPTDSVFAGMTLLGELRQGVPSVPGSSLFRDQVREARKLPGKEYLNVEFGWAPLVRDVQKLLHAVDQSDQIMQQYIAGSGTNIRRRLVSRDQSTVSGGQGGFNLTPNPSSVVGYAYGTEENRTINKVWFSGCFRYSIPESKASSNVGRLALTARKLYGVELTPEVVWNLAPWSWAADWFGNTGDIMHNVSALGRDGLTLRWGYQMQECTSINYSNAVIDRSGQPVARSYGSSYKRRIPATPWGFGVSTESLSPKQAAIAAAVIFSR